MEKHVGLNIPLTDKGFERISQSAGQVMRFLPLARLPDSITASVFEIQTARPHVGDRALQEVPPVRFERATFPYEWAALSC